MNRSTLFVSVLVTLLAVSFSACNSSSSSSAVPDGEFVVSGTLTNAPAGTSIFLNKVAYTGAQSIDTAIISQEGQFTFKGSVKEKGLYNIIINQQKSWLIVLDNGEKINFAGDHNDVLTYEVTGTKDNLIMTEVIGEMAGLQSQIRQKSDEFKQIYNSSRDGQTMMALQQEIGTLNKQYSQLLKNVTDTTSSPYVRLFTLLNMNMEQNSAYIEETLAELDNSLSGYSLLNQYRMRYNQNKAQNATLEIGSTAPDFELEGPDGAKTYSLHDIDAKYILVDFWASWCKPCRIENPNLVNTYKKYKDKGFTVYSVSLDKSRDKWKAAIAADNLSWKYHGSNLAFWSCPVAKQYKVNSIPATFLLDENKNVIATNLRGNRLEQKLQELYGS